MPGRRPTGAKKKPNDRLRSVVEETTVPASVDLLKENSNFAFPSETTWALLVLEVESIGGLSKRDRNDESKGQLIELIRNDHIHVIATEEMIEAEVLGIIPDHDTMSRLDEFSMMTSAVYSWGVAWYSNDDLIIEQSDSTTSFEEVRDVSLGNMTLRKAVGEDLWNHYSGEASARAAAAESDEDADQTETETEAAAGVYDEDSPIFDQDEIQDDGDEGPVYGEDEDEPDFEDADLQDDPESTQVISSVGLNDGAEDEGKDQIDVSDDAAADEPEQSSPGVALPSSDYSLDDEEDEGDLNADEAQDEEPWNPPAGQSFEDGQYEVEATVPVETFADQRQVQDAIARRFLSGDLDLDVDLASFNATFGIGAPVVQIEVPTGSSEWLADQISQLTRQANAALYQLHQSNQDRMRTTYVNLSSQHAQNIEKTVSFEKPDSPYGKLKAQADARREEALGEKDRRIRQARTEVLEQYNRQAEEAGEAAQRTAKASYLERHRSRMEREQADRASQIETSIEVDHSADMDKINDLRRRGAALKMEKGQTAIFETLAEKQQSDHESEQKLLAEWSDYIARFVDDHRKADLTRAEALAEHDRRTDELAAAQRDHDSIVAAMEAEHEQQLHRSKIEAKAAEAAIRAQLERLNAEWQHEVDLKNAKLETAEKEAIELREKNASIEEEVEQRFRARIEQLREDRDAAQRGNDQISDMQRRSNSMLIVLIVVLGILAFVAGGIFFSTILGG